MPFSLKSNYEPSLTQINAVDKLYQTLKDNHNEQVLLGVTGSGKTFTMAQLIAKHQKPLVKQRFGACRKVVLNTL